MDRTPGDPVAQGRSFPSPPADRPVGRSIGAPQGFSTHRSAGPCAGQPAPRGPIRFFPASGPTAPVPRTILDEAKCPACGTAGLEYAAETVELPYMGKSLETLIRCLQCGYRHTDFVLTESKDPTRVSYRVTAAEDMMVRVVRSSSGTIRIPELGIMIEPGISSEAFISNVEGIIVRIERVLDQLHRDAEEDGVRERIEALQALFGRLREGQADPITLILEDPFGNSSILADKAVAEPIPEDEADQLKVGMMVIDPQGDLAENLDLDGPGDDGPAPAA